MFCTVQYTETFTASDGTYLLLKIYLTTLRALCVTTDVQRPYKGSYWRGPVHWRLPWRTSGKSEGLDGLIPVFVDHREQPLDPASRLGHPSLPAANGDDELHAVRYMAYLAWEA